MSEPLYDVAVVGAGMFGAAAAKYLSAAGLRTLVVGPGEPENWQEHEGVFASHYDEARITRVVDPDVYWGELAARSIEQYAAIEEESGIKFHYPVGCLRVVGPQEEELCVRNGTKQNADFDVLSSQETARQFPYFHFPPGVSTIWERGAAGYLNPRKLVQAQLQIAQKQGAVLERQTVQQIIPQHDAVQLTTREGQTFRALKVLVAAGAYTKFLLRHSQEIQTHPVQVVLAEVEGPAPDMPCLIYSLINHPRLGEIFEDAYLLPPIRYPDGKWYLKIGAFPHHLQVADTPEELQNWFRQEPADEETHATQLALNELMPALKVLSQRVVPCVWTYAPQTRPYIKILEQEDAGGRIAVATGGCGRAAKSSDAIGKLGAELLI